MLKVGTIKIENIKDTFIRSPWWYLNLNSYKVSVKTTLKGKKIGTRDEK